MTQQTLINYQRRIEVADNQPGKVGQGWYQGFAARHPVLVAKTVVKFGTKRSEWVTVDNFIFMYDQTYLEFVKARIVLEMDEETYLDNKGNIVLEYDKKRLGNKTRYELQHP